MKLNKKIIYFLSTLVVLVVLIAIFLPSIFHSLGFHPDYEGEKFNLKGKKALIVSTSHGILNKPGETTGRPTGVFASEMTIPYYEFFDANMEVDVASIKGGQIPIDPTSFLYFLESKQDKRFEKDEAFQAKIKKSIPIAEIDIKNYDIVFFAGGWGAAYDMNSEIIAKKVSDAYYNSDVIFGSVCHGALAFTEARDKNGDYLIKGRPMTGVTQKQIITFGIEFTPYHPEEELKKAGALYKADRSKRIDQFATITVIDQEKRFVTGQNQNSSHETAQLNDETLKEKGL
ncbi:MAG: type 1 glutamine amidotransferase domain-containing protein [Microscillaceae bacterium]|nr:type 1 glutamine amidotransferase domain-containing protein [Microscillaceae bacterium]